MNGLLSTLTDSGMPSCPHADSNLSLGLDGYSNNRCYCVDPDTT